MSTCSPRVPVIIPEDTIPDKKPLSISVYSSQIILRTVHSAHSRFCSQLIPLTIHSAHSSFCSYIICRSQSKYKFEFILIQLSSISTPLQIGLYTIAENFRNSESHQHVAGIFPRSCLSWLWWGNCDSGHEAVKAFIETHKILFEQCKRIAQIRLALRKKLLETKSEIK